MLNGKFGKKKKANGETKELLKKYIEFLKKLIVDKDILNEIIDAINTFEEEGIITFGGNNLYARTLDVNGADYLEIKPDNNLMCIYTCWNGKKNLIVSQVELKNGNTKVEKTEKIEYNCPEEKNENNTKKQSKIYGVDGQVIYEEELEKKEEYDSKKGMIVYYPSDTFTNTISINEKWYLPNDSILSHEFKKENFSTEEVVDRYSICPKVIYDGHMTYASFNEIDKQLFDAIMTGQMSVEEVLEQNVQLKKIRSFGIERILN